MLYNKPAITLTQQILTLKQRGLIINDEAYAERLLGSIGYFNWLNSINPDNSFVQDFKQLLAKYPIVDSAAMGFPRGWQSEPLWK